MEMETKFETVRSQKLTDLTNEENIHSVVPVKSGIYNTVCLAVTVYSRIPGLDLPLYLTSSSHDGGTYYIQMGLFTYKFPIGVAVPSYNYSNIRILHKKATISYGREQTWVRCRFTKKTLW